MNPSDGKRRSLILAGGGLKVAFQAGVMQVWLDEAGFEFEHVDGASGGTFNLAMLCQGMNGSQIADNWRGLPILRGISPNWRAYIKLIFGESLMTYKRWRRNIYPLWGLDFNRIRNSKLDATFNVYNFTDHRVEVLPPAAMSEDALTACVSLPMWFPPVRMNNKVYIDAVYQTDANLPEAARRGVDEIWVIWTVSERGIWKNGFVANYFQVIETAGNGTLRADIERIEQSNRAIERGEPGEFGRVITIRILRAEVPLHYLINFSSKKFTRAVELGVYEARRWCQRHDIALGESRSPAPLPTGLRFTETMRGHVSAGTGDFDQGATGNDRTALAVTLTIRVDDVRHFVDDPDHTGSITGTVESPLVGGVRPVLDGTFNLFVDVAPDHRRMFYHLVFEDDEGNPHTLFGYKDVYDDRGFDAWADTTTLFTRIYRGRVDRDDVETTESVATGIIRISLPGFLKQLTTFRTHGPDFRERFGALARFGKFFTGSLWATYVAGKRVTGNE